MLLFVSIMVGWLVVVEVDVDRTAVAAKIVLVHGAAASSRNDDIPKKAFRNHRIVVFKMADDVASMKL